MAFWLFMLIMNLLIPFTMIGFGFYFQKHPPKEINELFGYRTSLSMKNEDTWKTAHVQLHVQFGRVWLIWGWFSAAFSFPCMLLLYGKVIQHAESTESFSVSCNVLSFFSHCLL